jgi:hypothetical protein
MLLSGIRRVVPEQGPDFRLDHSLDNGDHKIRCPSNPKRVVPEVVGTQIRLSNCGWRQWWRSTVGISLVPGMENKLVKRRILETSLGDLKDLFKKRAARP